MPRLQLENLDKNIKIFERINTMATKRGCTPSQLALAWIHHLAQQKVIISFRMWEHYL
ncbi:hypothetical protein PR202_gb26017 [Eleusine coracana subsp. coracana]|uniref:NADP-dependent oxidoreductase domain-containing protein n=1 Tax=Eleusine coracana subsp. coracana TaxID=191504 RepID=A0AAV5FN49_ELECO|nr:hypothetical protein PR202_gb26017 [Eleusine coracana subsp. coracana]